MSSFNVDTVFHSAAYKHVPLVEQNIVEGVQNNIMGTRTVVKAAIEANVDTFTLISTDKAVRPTNFMGATKRIAELVCQAYAGEQSTTCISIVRFGNVLWSSGSVLPRFKEQIVNGGPVTVTHPGITRYFMTISEAVHLVLQASAMARGGEVFVLDMGEPVKIVELAKSMIRLHGMIPYLETDATDGNGDIRISFSGLRPGEKLHEELLVGSDVSGTNHPRIMCADESKLEFDQLQNLLESLQHACDEMDMPYINSLMKNAAVDFRPTGAVTDLLCPASDFLVPAGGATGKIIDIKKKRKRK
jgi:FlaA1/EpsC-like NDP-sugar epimerase